MYQTDSRGHVILYFHSIRAPDFQLCVMCNKEMRVLAPCETDLHAGGFVARVLHTIRQNPWVTHKNNTLVHLCGEDCASYLITLAAVGAEFYSTRHGDHKDVEVIDVQPFRVQPYWDMGSDTTRYKLVDRI